MHRGSRGKSRGWCWWHELFRGSRRRRWSRDFIWFFPPSFFVITLLAFGFFFFSFFSFSLLLFFPYSFFSIYHSIGSRVFLFLVVSGSTRRARIELCKGWGLCGGLNIYPCVFFPFLLFPFGSRCAGKCVRTCVIERRALFWSRSERSDPLPSLNLSFYLLLGFLSMVFLRKKIPSPLSSFSFLYRDINYRSLIK